MGSLAARGVAEGDWTSIWQAVIVDLFSGGSARRHSSCATAAFATGIDVAEREEISRGIASHRSMRVDGEVAGPFAVDGEPGNRRNGGYDRYRAAVADEKAWARARRPKRCKLANNPRLRGTVARKLRSNWSPEQIAGWLKRAYPEDEHSQVSHETIYRSLYIQARGVLKKELLRHLRSKRTMRRAETGGRQGTARTNRGSGVDQPATGNG